MSSVLAIHNLESRQRDTLLFPSFSLNIEIGEIIAMYSSLNVRHVLLDIFTGKRTAGQGDIQVLNVGPSHKEMYFKNVGILFFDDGLYNRLSVRDHIKYYKGIHQSPLTIENVLSLTQLQTLQHKKVQKLSFSEKRRLHFAHMLLKDSPLYIFEEPDLNVDIETRRVFINLTKKWQQEQKSMLILTSNMENAITAADKVFQLDTQGLTTIEMDNKEKENNNNIEQTETIHFDKIPAKVNDKIILFDPTEIDYIESHEGQSNLHIKGETFSCVFTLTDLEERLKAFGFFRCHRSYIVNLQKVREVITWTRNSFNLILDDEQKSSIPLSKTKMAQLKNMLGLK